MTAENARQLGFQKADVINEDLGRSGSDQVEAMIRVFGGGGVHREVGARRV